MKRFPLRHVIFYPLAVVAGGIVAMLLFWFTREAQVGAASGPGSAAAGIGEPAFIEAVSRFAGADWTDGEVELLLNGEGTFPRLWQDLRSARRSVTFANFWIRPGAPADSLGRILAERARAGVRVLFLYDAFGAELPDRYLAELRAAGVQVAELRPLSLLVLFKAQHRSHVRAVVVDGIVGYTGGFGIDPHWLGGGVRPGEWRDTNVRVTGPLAAQIQTVFLATWAEAAGQLLTGEPFFPGAFSRPPADSGLPARAGPPVGRSAIVYSPATIGSTAAERLLALTHAGARQRLYATSAYFAPEDDLAALLARAARRGVDVRVLTASEHTDQPLARRAGRAKYERLLRAGVRIYEYAPAMVHAKTIVADGRWSIVGTINMDNRSLALNDEIALVSTRPELAAALEAVFAADIARAREIRLEEFRRRSAWQRLRERAAVLALRVL